MEREDWNLAKEIFGEAMDLPSEARQAFIEARCGDHSALRQQLQSLLSADDMARTFLERPVADASNLTARLHPGDVVGSIRIVEVLGEGGMGSVYKGVDERLGRTVALKSIRSDHRFSDAARLRFRREARMLSQLDHPHICRIYEFLEEGDQDYLVLEYIEGRNLSDLERDALSYEQKLKVAAEIADVLRVAHAMSIIHRDLKPDNVMLTPSGEVKVLDFGIARHASDADEPASLTSPSPKNLEAAFSALTEMGVIVGTPRFMSPEHARGEAVTAASDMYSFGLLLQILFTGTPPYDEDTAGLKLLMQAMNGETAPVRGVPSDLKALIEKLKSLDPEHRPTAGETRDALIGILDAPKRRNRSRLIALGVALLCLATFLSSIGFILASRSEHRAQKAAEAARQAQLAAEEQSQVAQKARDQTDAVNDFLLDMLASADPEKKGPDVKVVEVLDDAAARARGASPNDLPLKAHVLKTLGSTYMAIGEYDKALEILKLSKDLFFQQEGPDTTDSISAVSLLAAAHYYLGHYDEAITGFQQGVNSAGVVFGRDHLESLKLKTSLATLMDSRGMNAEAEHLLRENLKALIAQTGEKDETVARTLSNLGLSLFRQGKFEEAESTFRRTLEIKRQLHGHDAPSTLRTEENLAMACIENGKLDEARLILERVLSTSQEVLGPEHPSLLKTLNMLAVCHERLGEYDEARKLLETCLTEKTRVFGPDHPATLNSLHNLGKLLQTMGKYEQARDRLEQAWESSKQVLGPAHPDTLESGAILAEVISHLGQQGRAVSILQEVVERRVDAFGKHVVPTLAAYFALAQVQARAGMLPQAEVNFSEALRIGEEIVGAQDPRIQSLMMQLGDCLEKQGKTDAAREIYQKASGAGSEEAAEAVERLRKRPQS